MVRPETDTSALRNAKLDIVTVATADFVKSADGTWLEQHVSRGGFQLVNAGKVIHQEGSVNGVTVTLAPSPTPDISQALSHITITACRFQPGEYTTTSGWTQSKYGPQYSSSTTGEPAGVNADFINDSPADAKKVTFAIAFAGTLLAAYEASYALTAPVGPPPRSRRHQQPQVRTRRNGAATATTPGSRKGVFSRRLYR